MPSLMNGQTVVESWSVIKGSPAEPFAAARGLRVVTSMTRQRLALTEPPEVGELPPGYELVTWKGAAPEEFVGAYVDGLNAIADAPFGETTLDHAHNTVESIRREEAEAVADRWVIKARMLHNLAGVETIYTRTSSENSHMLRVNHSLSYEDTYVYMAVQAKTADLQP
ncbi:hypothetical protein ACWGE0_22305 [Lentzea sp. NPDC054927]